MLFRKGLPQELKRELQRFIDRYYESPEMWIASADCAAAEPRAASARKAPRKALGAAPVESAVPRSYRAAGAADAEEAAAPAGLAEALSELDESFQEMLLRKIDEKGMKDSECYKRAGVDRKLFSKIRSNPQYRPKKTTAIAFCMALELSWDEAVEMLRKAGYALSRSSVFDVIVMYFLKNQRYSIDELNCALYEYDQNLIGY